MKTEYYPVITPDEGMMLYNEKRGSYSDKVYVGRLDSVDDWQEVPMAQYEAYLKAEEERMEAERRQMEAESAGDSEASAPLPSNPDTE